MNRSAALATTHQQVRDFACMLTERRGREVIEWINRVQAGGTQPLRAFTTGLRSDHAAVTAGLSLAYSSGPVEGQVTDLDTPIAASVRDIASNNINGEEITAYVTEHTH